MRNEAIFDEVQILKEIIGSFSTVKKIYLFGSLAYGQPDENSDIDLYVVLKNEAAQTYFEEGIRMRSAVAGKISVKTDILVKPERTFLARARQGGYLEQTIMQKGICIY